MNCPRRNHPIHPEVPLALVPPAGTYQRVAGQYKLQGEKKKDFKSEGGVDVFIWIYMLSILFEF